MLYLSISLLLIAAVISIIYIYAILTRIGAPRNLSMVYYHLGGLHEKGLFSTAYMVALATLIGIAWLILCKALHLSLLLTGLAITAVVVIYVVAIFSAYRENIFFHVVHYAFALTSVACFLIWVHLMQRPLFFFIVPVIIMWQGVAIITKTIRTSWVFWLEMAWISCLISVLFIIAVQHL